MTAINIAGWIPVVSVVAAVARLVFVGYIIKKDGHLNASDKKQLLAAAFVRGSLELFQVGSVCIPVDIFCSIYRFRAGSKNKDSSSPADKDNTSSGASSSASDQVEVTLDLSLDDDKSNSPSNTTATANTTATTTTEKPPENRDDSSTAVDTEALCYQAQQLLTVDVSLTAVQEAIVLYQKAAKAGSWLACFRLYEIYRDNVQGVVGEPGQEDAFLKKAIEIDEQRAWYLLGKTFVNGSPTVACDLGMAIVYYIRAAQAGHVDARARLGEIASAREIDQFAQMASDYFPTACNDLAKALHQRGEYVKAVQLFYSGARREDARAMCNLGACYAGGAGVTRDLEKAKYWFTEAMKGDFPAAFTKLGQMKLAEHNIKASEDALELFSQAVAKGDAEGNFYLGVMYARNFGVLKDFARAKEHLTVAQQKGYPGSQEIITSIEMEERALQGNEEARSAMATMYREGRPDLYIEKDSQQAERFSSTQASTATTYAVNVVKKAWSAIPEWKDVANWAAM